MNKVSADSRYNYFGKPCWRKRWNPYTGISWKQAKQKNKKVPRLFQTLREILIHDKLNLSMLINQKKSKRFPKKQNEKLERIRLQRKLLTIQKSLVNKKSNQKQLKFESDYNAFKDDLEGSEDVKNFCKNKERALLLYQALCNNMIISLDNEREVRLSWRSAGALVAELRNQGEDYLDFYISGNEGRVDPSVEFLMYSIGWKIVSTESY